MMMSTQRRQQGTTLVEILVAGGMLLSLGMITVLWLSGVTDLWWTSSTQSALRSTTEMAVNRMSAELRSATRTAAGSPPNAVVVSLSHVRFYLPIDTDGNGSIVDAQGNIEWSPPCSPPPCAPGAPMPIDYQYDAPSRQLRRLQNSQTQVIADHVTSVTFTDRNADASLKSNEVKIALMLSATTPQRRTVSSATTEIVRLRN